MRILWIFCKIAVSYAVLLSVDRWEERGFDVVVVVLVGLGWEEEGTYWAFAEILLGLLERHCRW